MAAWLSSRASLLAFVAVLGVASAVDHAKFRTCSQTGFCRRRRNAEIARGYVVAPSSVSTASGAVNAQLHGGPFGVALSLSLQAYASGSVRVRVVETNPLHGARWEPSDILEKDIAPAPLKAITAAGGWRSESSSKVKGSEFWSGGERFESGQ